MSVNFFGMYLYFQNKLIKLYFFVDEVGLICLIRLYLKAEVLSFVCGINHAVNVGEFGADLNLMLSILKQTANLEKFVFFVVKRDLQPIDFHTVKF